CLSDNDRLLLIRPGATFGSRAEPIARVTTEEETVAYSLPQDAALRGPFQPMRFEATVDECIVSHGEIPPELSGGFYRTGPTWKRPTIQGTTPLLTMDGMVQGLVLDNGRADYKNRWIRTPKYLLEEKHGRGMFEWTDAKWHDWP